MGNEERGIQTFRLNHSGLARLFGELEAQVMDLIWEHGPATVGNVVDRLEDEYHYNTIMTVMNRLVEKGYLARRREGRAFIYTTVDDRETFLALASRQISEGLLQDFGVVALTQFVNAVDQLDPALLRELRRLTSEKLKGEGK